MRDTWNLGVNKIEVRLCHESGSRVAFAAVRAPVIRLGCVIAGIFLIALALAANALAGTARVGPDAFLL
jgi:hypothetical protein